MKQIGFLLTLLIALAQQNCKAQNPEMEFQNKEYQNLLHRFHSYVDNSELAGTVIFLEKDGILTKNTYGYQDIASKTPMKENSIFRWASMTKPIVATAIMQLVEQDKIGLDDPVAKYIPKVGQMKVYDGTPTGKKPRNTMTIRHLLSHTSGSTSTFDFSDAGKATAKAFAGKSITNLQELVDVICETQLAFEPGEGWAYGYSNDLLAFIIEKVTDLSIEQYLKEHIFTPLQMHHTSFQAVDSALLTSVYTPDSNSVLQAIETSKNSRYVDGRNFPRGNGGLTGTAGDYLNFCRMILNKGSFHGEQLLQSASIKLMMQNVVGEQSLPIKIAHNTMTGQGYGLGFGIVMKGSPFGTQGDIYWPGALYTYFFINPKTNSIGIFMTQLYDLSRMELVWEFHELATKALESM